MSVQLCFETHQTTVDNETGIATGWLPGRLSELGRRQAGELGERRRDDGLSAVFSSDLRRAVESVEIAFAGSHIPVLLDWRLRECDYGELNGAPRDQVFADPMAHLTTPYPGGESWQQAVDRVETFLADLLTRWDGARVLVVGHVATRLGLDHHLRGIAPADALATDFVWQPGWEYVVPSGLSRIGPAGVYIPSCWASPTM
ncbi:MAG: histidine phosphatase family protein [Nocardioides sp.]